MELNKRPKTIFCDIDGTLIYSFGNLHDQVKKEPKVLSGTIEKLIEWDRKGFNIILTTGRRESLRKVTEIQLSDLGIFYDKLIMGIGGGTRYIINDLKPDNDTPTAIAINLKRNKGIKDVEI
jgi:hypothetical protein